MNPGTAHAIDSLFGPPSNAIDIGEFLQTASTTNHYDSTHSQTLDLIPPQSSWNLLSEEEKNGIDTECSVSDIETELLTIWDNPTLSGHILQDHDRIVNALHATIKPTTKAARKHLPDPDQVPAEITALQNNLDSVKLSSWKLQTDSALFIRTPKNSDRNVLVALKPSPRSSVLSSGNQCSIIVSIYSRPPWGPSYVSRSSQHALLSSQTLQDLVNVIPCSSNVLLPYSIETERSSVDGTNIGGKGYAICVEGVVYGQTNYAEKVLQHLQTVSKKPPFVQQAPSSLSETPLSSLLLRVNEPYWMLHQGNCEHFAVVDEIRLCHPSDPLSGYPLTLHITPLLLDICRCCSKVPAVWSIVGDVRLGESPCVLCGPCWANMGTPTADPSVVAVPLPQYGS